MFKDFCSKYYIKILQTTAYHPNTNGVCERANGTLKRIIGKYVNDRHKDWDRFVNRAAFSMNIAIHSITRKPPYLMLYGQKPMLPCDVGLPTITAQIDEELSDHHKNRATRAMKDATQAISPYVRFSKYIFRLCQLIYILGSTCELLYEYITTVIFDFGSWH